MPYYVSRGVRLPRVNDPHPDVATFMIARALAEVYRDVLEEPVPGRLLVILHQMKKGLVG